MTATRAHRTHGQPASRGRQRTTHHGGRKDARPARARTDSSRTDSSRTDSRRTDSARARRQPPARRKVTAPPPRERRQRRVGSPRRRLIAALVVLCCLLVLIVARVGQIQTSEAEVLRPAALEQWTRSYDIPAHRGTLFDRNGNELALSVPAVTVSINPKLVENGAATVQLLDDLLELDDDTTTALLAEISARRRGFMYVARQVEPSIGEQIDALGLAGVNVDDEDRRVMPGGDTGR